MAKSTKSKNKQNSTIAKIALRTDVKSLKSAVDSAMPTMPFVEVNINSGITWKTLFLNYDIPVTDDLYIIKNDPGTIVSQITDTIESFVAQYKKSRDVYCAKIMNMPKAITPAKSTSLQKVKAMKTTPTKQKASAARSPISKSKRISKQKVPKIIIKRPTEKSGKENVSARTRKTEAHSPGNRFVAFNDVDADDDQMYMSGFQFDNRDTDENMDTASQFSIFTQDIPTAENNSTSSSSDVKTAVIDSMVKNLSNSVLLRMKEEYDDLKRRGKWLRLASHIPLMGCFMSEVFSDNNFKKVN